MHNGGKRPGAGRPRKADRYAAPIAAAEDTIADQLPRLLKNMLKLANGGYYEDEVELAPAGVVTTGSGEFESKVFPDKPDDELVVVKKKRRKAAPDRKANEYLIDRILGRPTQAVEIDADPDGSLEVTAAAMSQAAHELELWRKQMTEQLSTPSAPPTPPTPATPTA